MTPSVQCACVQVLRRRLVERRLRREQGLVGRGRAQAHPLDLPSCCAPRLSLLHLPQVPYSLYLDWLLTFLVVPERTALESRGNPREGPWVGASPSHRARHAPLPKVHGELPCARLDVKLVATALHAIGRANLVSPTSSRARGIIPSSFLHAAWVWPRRCSCSVPLRR